MKWLRASAWVWTSFMFGCAGVPAVTDPAGLPDVKVGNHWTYRVYAIDPGNASPQEFSGTLTREVQQVTNDAIWVRDQSSVVAEARLQKFDRAWNLLEVSAKNTVVTYSPRVPMFSFPLGARTEWGGNFSRTQKGSPEEGSLRMEGKVSGWENITVAAGTFRALRVDLLTPGYASYQPWAIFADPKQWGGIAESYWYAPQTKSFVKYYYRRYINNQLMRGHTMELISFGDQPAPSLLQQQASSPAQRP